MKLKTPSFALDTDIFCFFVVLSLPLCFQFYHLQSNLFSSHGRGRRRKRIVPCLQLQAEAHKKQQCTCEWETFASKMLWMVSPEMWVEIGALWLTW
jgi:hypothetical protein